MKKIEEEKITFTTTKEGEHVELRISVAGWEGRVDESSVNYNAPSPRRWYGVRNAHRTDEDVYDGFTLEEVEQGVFEFKLESREGAKEEAERAAAREAEENRIRQEGYDAGEKEGEDWMSAQVEYVLGHNLEELAEHLPEIRQIFGDPEPAPQRRGQSRGESRVEGRGQRR